MKFAAAAGAAELAGTFLAGCGAHGITTEVLVADLSDEAPAGGCASVEKRLRAGYLEYAAKSLDDALEHIERWRAEKRAASVAICGNAASICSSSLASRGRS